MTRQHQYYHEVLHQINFTVDKIRSTSFSLHEKEKSLRKLNDYHIYVSNALSHYHTMDNNTKMCFIKPVLQDTIMIQLEERGALPSCFDHANDDPFYLAPFTTEDFRSDLKKVVNYRWHKLSEEKMSARKSCAVALNSRQYIVNLALYNNAC